VNTQDRVGWTPLHIACCEGGIETVQVLLDAGADASRAAANGSTPLHVAARNRHAAAVRLLVAAGVDLAALDQVGATPLHVVAEHIGDAELVAAMLRAVERRASCADASTSADVPDPAELLARRDAAGWQPLHCAVHAGRWDAVRLLLDAGAAAADTGTPAGACPVAALNALQLACYCGHEGLAWRLLEGGYEAATAGPRARTALHYAALGPLQHSEPWLFSIQPLDPTRVVPPSAIRSSRAPREVVAALAPFLMASLACVQHGGSAMVRLTGPGRGGGVELGEPAD